MKRLDELAVLDYTSQLARLRPRADCTVLPPRDREEYITFHYSGVAYDDRSHDAELRAILGEARYQMDHDYGAESYPDGYLYDFVVLSDGTKVRTRKSLTRLWHCANYRGNRKSWSVHALLGPGQNLTDPQRASLFELFDALRAETNIPRQNVVAHCEWPYGDGEPLRSPSYRLLPRQSQCPGPILFPHIVAYRSLPDAPARYRVRERLAVYEVPRVDPKRIALGGRAALPAGHEVTIDATYASGMGHLVGGLGFVELSKLEAL